MAEANVALPFALVLAGPDFPIGSSSASDAERKSRMRPRRSSCSARECNLIGEFV